MCLDSVSKAESSGPALYNRAGNQLAKYYRGFRRLSVILEETEGDFRKHSRKCEATKCVDTYSNHTIVVGTVQKTVSGKSNPSCLKTKPNSQAPSRQISHVTGDFQSNRFHQPKDINAARAAFPEFFPQGLVSSGCCKESVNVMEQMFCSQDLKSKNSKINSEKENILNWYLKEYGLGAKWTDCSFREWLDFASCSISNNIFHEQWFVDLRSSRRSLASPYPHRKHFHFESEAAVRTNKKRYCAW